MDTKKTLSFYDELKMNTFSFCDELGIEFCDELRINLILGCVLYSSV